MSRGARSGLARRNWGSDDSATPFMHVDMDAFFVSVELLDKPHLRGLPVAVGGREHGVVSAASYEARGFGVNSAMPVAQAKRLCPQLRVLPVDNAKYAQVSDRIMEYLRSITPYVEQISIDEAFLNVASVRKLLGSPVQIGEQIRCGIRAVAGVPASVGIANTKHLAKIASAHAKPDGLLLVPASASLDFLHSLPVGALWGVGDKTRDVLEHKGVHTVGDVAALGEAALVRALGKAAGAHLYALSMNRDERVVEPVRLEKSMSKEQTFFKPLSRLSDVEKTLLDQAYELGYRLRVQGVQAGVISVKMRSASFVTVSRSVSLSVPTSSSKEIYRRALSLLHSMSFPCDGVRLIGVKVSNLIDVASGSQLSFDDDGRDERIDRTLDVLRSRYGKAVVAPASLW